MRLRIEEKTLVADDLLTLTLTAADGSRLPDWTPGAHIDLVLPNGLTRQYSLCGDPWDAYRYRIGVLREPAGRGGSQYIHDILTPDMAVGLGGPRNNFALVPSDRYLFIAGGIGITPLLPMLRQAEQMGAEWSLLYLGRSRSTMAFLDELSVYGDRVTIHAADELGRADLGDWLSEQRQDTKVYVCGPARLLDGVDELCGAWRHGWVRMERFSAKEQGSPARSTPFEIEIAGTGKVITVSPEENVVTALRAAGQTVMTSCAIGVCGTCETTVLAGEPDHRDSILDDAERHANNCMFPCVSRARSDRIVVAL
ncbi:PDR/VanB family oxidoreductase [Microbacterium foliorum]